MGKVASGVKKHRHFGMGYVLAYFAVVFALAIAALVIAGHVSKAYAGNKADSDGARIADSAIVANEAAPAQSLTLKLAWESQPDVAVREERFSLDDLDKMLAKHHCNATVVKGTSFGVVSADGYLLGDVVGLISADDESVLQLRFSTTTGDEISYSYAFLFGSGSRYYFPNYDIGSYAEGQVVAPLLATRSVTRWDESLADPAWELEDDARFHLVVGCLPAGGANAAYQLRNVDAITVVLAGQPQESAAVGDGALDGGEDAGRQSGLRSIAVKKSQTITAKNITKTLKAKKGKLAKKATINVKSLAKVKAKTTVKYKATIAKADKKFISFNAKTAKITVKKGLKKGCHKVKVKLTAVANKTYAAAKAKTITVTIKVK